MYLADPPPDLRTRLAPTPSGFLHIGNAYSFLLTWVIARRNNGTVVLRIDDLDTARKRPEYLSDIFRSLEWLGLDYDEGPTGPDDFERNYSQHLRRDLFDAALENLRATDIAFACLCSRNSIRQESPDGRHPESCRAKNLCFDTPHAAWRVVTTPDETTWIDGDGMHRSVDLHETMRDFIVRRKDGIPSYQIASLVDDAYFRINTIVRGSDLLPSTAAQRWLAENLLSQNDFLDGSFVHHGLLPDSDGRKLSKSDGSTSLKAMRESGGNADNIFVRLSPRFGLTSPVHSAIELLEALPRSPN